MKWFSNLKIANKLIVGFQIVALIAAIVGIVGIININGISKKDSYLYQENTLGVQYAGETAISFGQMSYYVLKTLTMDTQKDFESNKQNIDKYLSDTKSSFDAFRSIPIEADDTEILQLIDSISVALSDYEKYLNMHLDYLTKGYKTQADSFVNKSMAPLGEKLRDSLLQLMQAASDEAKEKAKENTADARNGIITTVVILIVTIVIAQLLGTRIARVIGQPVTTMANLGKLLATGDTNVDKVLKQKDYSLKLRKDEVGELAAAFDALVETTKTQISAIQKIAGGNLKAELKPRSENDTLTKALIDLTDNFDNLVSSVVLAADQVTSGALMVSNSSFALSQGATEQASSVQELTATLNEIAAKTAHNVQNAEQANAFAIKAKQYAAEGNSQMKVMLQAMDDINVSSGNISKIIKVIDDIAFQTNILALNAAVEAARAGQHGKGFAVVAEEVRTLAAKSASAANETTELIENSINKVDTGTKIARSTADALGKIVEQVDEAAVLVNAISEASVEQSMGIEQVDQGISQVSQVVQTNAATAEESAAASQQLTAQAEQLMQTISVFKTKRFIKTANQFGQKSVNAHAAKKPAVLAAPKTAPVKSFGKY
jgi:methyl-accepting chemotaxis protein